MKVVRLPMPNGDIVTALVHDYYVIEPEMPRPRAVDLWSMLMAIDGDGKDEYQVKAGWNAGYTLQAKLAAVGYHYQALADVAQEPNDEERTPYVRPYGRAYRLLTALDAYLNSMYAVVETIATFRKAIDRTLPSSFRKQMYDASELTPERNPWLLPFYDLRSEFSHYSSAILAKEGNSVRVQFRRQKDNLYFKDKATSHLVELELILSFERGLMEMLDVWSRSQIAKLDPEAGMETWVVMPNGVPRMGLMKLGRLLELSGL